MLCHGSHSDQYTHNENVSDHECVHFHEQVFFIVLIVLFGSCRECFVLSLCVLGVLVYVSRPATCFRVL